MNITSYLGFRVAATEQAADYYNNLVLTQISLDDLSMEQFNEFEEELTSLAKEASRYKVLRHNNGTQCFTQLLDTVTGDSLLTITFIHDGKLHLLANKEGILALEIAGRETLIRSLLLDKL